MLVKLDHFPRDRDENYMLHVYTWGKRHFEPILAFLALPQPPRHHDLLWPQDEGHANEQQKPPEKLPLDPIGKEIKSSSNYIISSGAKMFVQLPGVFVGG